MSRTGALCTATSKRTHKQCRALAISGSEPLRCRHHIGSVKARDRAAVRAELASWRVTDQVLDDKVVMLRLMTQAYRRAAYYGWLLEQVQDDAGTDLVDLLGSLIGTVKRAAGPGSVFDSEEAIRGLVVLEGQERDRAFRFAKDCRAAGIDEHLVRIEEAKAAAIVSMIRRVLIAAGADPSDPKVSAAIGRELRQLEASDTTPGAAA